MNCQVVIIGAGIGGLTAALSLQHFGFNVSVFEQAPALKEIGAGLLVTPNGMRALEFLGVGKQVASSASTVDWMYIKHYATGETLQARPSDVTRRKYGMDIYQVHRADLHTALSTAVLENDPGCVHVGHTFVDLVQKDGRVTAHFENGMTVTGDTLIGSDGNASTVRARVFPTEPPVFTRQVAMRALVPAERVPEEIRVAPKCLYIGPGRMFLHYFLRKNTIMNVIALGREPKWQEEGWAVPAEVREFLDLYHDFHPNVLRLIQAVSSERLFKWGLRDRDPLQNWTSGRVSMLGDAAHPMSPFLGQGANMAIEDGLVLGRCFQKGGSVEEALMRYEAARKERGTNVQLWSREEADALQGNTPIGFHPGRQAEDRGLFDYDPVTVPI